MKPVQPQGNVKIQMPVPEGYDLSRLAVYHISTDGGMTEIPFELQTAARYLRRSGSVCMLFWNRKRRRRICRLPLK